MLADKINYIRLVLLHEKHPKEVSSFLGISDISYGDYSKIPQERIRALFQFTDSDWQEWAQLREFANKLSKQYKSVFRLFITENFGKRVIDNLTLSELRLLCSESDANWLTRCEQHEKVLELNENFPNGVRLFNANNPRCKDKDFVKGAEIIKSLEERWGIYQSFVTFEEAQKEIGNVFPTQFPVNGCNTRIVPISYQAYNEIGSLRDSSFNLCVYSQYSFCRAHLEDQSPKMKEAFSYVEKFEKKKAYWNEKTYNDYCSLLDILNKKYEEKLYVAFVNKNSYNWSYDVYEYHYAYLRQELGKKGIQYGDFEDFCWKDCDIKCVVIFDFISNDSDIVVNAQLFSSKNPHLASAVYISVTRELSESEILNLNSAWKKSLAVDAEQLEKKTVEQSKKAFIKNEFLRVDKHPFYSYTAITNTLIGNAQGASTVKPLWLGSSSKYKFVIKDNIYTYSVDGGVSFQNIDFIGDRFDIDTVVDFTFQLFTRMGVLDMFMNNGKHAISFINAAGFLRKH